MSSLCPCVLRACIRPSVMLLPRCLWYALMDFTKLLSVAHTVTKIYWLGSGVKRSKVKVPKVEVMLSLLSNNHRFQRAEAYSARRCGVDSNHLVSNASTKFSVPTVILYSAVFFCDWLYWLLHIMHCVLLWKYVCCSIVTGSLLLDIFRYFGSVNVSDGIVSIGLTLSLD